MRKYIVSMALWKNLIVIFFILAAIFLLIPASIVGAGILRYAHMALSIALITVMIILFFQPILILLLNRNKYGAFKVFVCLLIMLIFNIVGSFILYFYLQGENKEGDGSREVKGS